MERDGKGVYFHPETNEILRVGDLQQEPVPRTEGPGPTQGQMRPLRVPRGLRGQPRPRLRPRQGLIG